jgi:hypothetical protein
MDKIVNISFVVCMFLAMEAIDFGFFDFHLYYALMVFCLPLLIYKYRTIDYWLFIVLLTLFLNGILNVLFENNDILSLIKSTSGIIFAYWFYFLVIKHNNFDLTKLFRLYYKFAFWIAVIGLAQFFSYLIGFKYGYDLSWLGFRVMGVSDLGGNSFYPIHSITGEPSSFALLLSPAVYISMCKLFKRGIDFGSNLDAILILVTYPLSQSSTGYFAIFISLLVLNLNQIKGKRILIAGITLPGSVLLLYTISPKFQERLESSFQLFTGEVVLQAATEQNSNGSSLILYNHFVIASENANDHPFGTGIGSHHHAFEKYNSLQTWFTGYGKHALLLNVHDASSLFNRILSEMGYVGIIFTILFLYKNFIRSDPTGNNLILTNHASLVILCTALLRSGHYFVYGLPFFVFCYYYSKKITVSNNKVSLHSAVS